MRTRVGGKRRGEASGASRARARTVCFAVLTTRTELETMSEVMAEKNPSSALRTSFATAPSYRGTFFCRKS